MSDDASKRDTSEKGEIEGSGRWPEPCDDVFFDQAPSATLVLDARGRILRANQRAYTILDPPENTLVGVRLEQFLLDSCTKAIEVFFSRTRESADIQTCELRFESASNKQIDTLVQARSIAHPDGQFIVMSLSDVSTWRGVDPQIILVEERLHHSQKMEALGRLSAGVVHSFNNILTVIAGYSRILLDDLDVSDERGHVQKIAHANGRAADLVSKMLLFGRGADAPAGRVLNLNKCVIDFEDMFKGIGGDKIELEALLEPNLPNIRIDGNQLDQILMNLAMNARDAMKEGGVLSFETSAHHFGEERPDSLKNLASGEFVELSVRDTGCGMPPEVARNVFEPFFSTKGVGHGTGLGLATVRSIMRECGGEVVLETTPEQGSCFRLFFPSADSSVDPSVEGLALLERSETHDTHILVVDENPEVRELIVYVLEQKGYDVTQSSLAEALEESRRAIQPYTLVLMDKNLPKPLTQEFLLGLRVQQPEIKFLFLSSHDANQVLETGIAELKKPFTSHQLCHAVRELLEE